MADAISTTDLIMAIPRESFPGERRVAMVPQRIAALRKAGLQIHVEAGAGVAAGFPDSQYAEQGAVVVANRSALLAAADIVLQLRAPGVESAADRADLQSLRRGAVLIAFADPFSQRASIEALAEHGVVLLALELLPRISRAQNMDALTSMASIAGYKAVIQAADRLAKLFPMMVTAAGTITAAKVLVLGAGVAGLQAIATARRLGAIVSGYDVRPAVKEQVQSLGARFVELPLDTADAQTAGGYAKEQSARQQERQRELLSRVVAESDVVITTAVVPGKKAPILITAEMVQAMTPGSIIVDLASDRGGNCSLTVRGQTVQAHGVTIIAAANLPAELPFHASQMYAGNMTNLLLHLIKDKHLAIDAGDPITRDMLVTRDGQVVHSLVRQAWGIPT